MATFWLATPTVEGACAVFQPHERENVGKKESGRRNKRNGRAEKVSITRRSRMASPLSTDNLENATAPFSEEQCQWLQRLAAQWARPPPSGPAAPAAQPSTSTANSGDSGSGELARRKTIKYSYRDGRWPTAHLLAIGDTNCL